MNDFSQSFEQNKIPQSNNLANEMERQSEQGYTNQYFQVFSNKNTNQHMDLESVYQQSED